MSAFKVGDVCVGHNLPYEPEYNGVECVITSEPFMVRRHAKGVSGTLPEELCYWVRWSDGDVSVQPPYTLRRIPPKAEPTYDDQFAPADPIAWEMTGWSPNKSKETV